MSFVFNCIMNQYKNIELVIFNLSREWNLDKEVIMVCTRSGILFFLPLSPDTGMTLPTGVSTFLLECLDTDSTEDYNTGASESLSSCPSPETFRDDEGLGETSVFFLNCLMPKKKSGNYLQ